MVGIALRHLILNSSGVAGTPIKIRSCVTPFITIMADMAMAVVMVTAADMAMVATQLLLK